MRQPDKWQWEELYRIARARVYNLLGPSPDAEDLVQDIMLSMVRAVQLHRHDSSYTTLLYVVTMRRYYDYLRRLYRSKTLSWLDLAMDGRTGLSDDGLRLLKVNALLGAQDLSKDQRSLLEAVRRTLVTRGGVT